MNVIAKQYKMTKDEGPVVDVLNALGDLGLFCYFIMDNLTFLMKVGILKGNPKALVRSEKTSELRPLLFPF